MSAFRQLLLGVVTQILAISCWFNAAAVVPGISAEYSLDAGQTGILTAGVQMGFACGALVVGVLRLTDRVSARRLIFWGALATALFTVLPTVIDGGFLLFSICRLLVGVGLAVVYPAGMRAVLSWAPARTRGMPVAALVAALTVGTAAPHLLAGSTPDGWRQVMMITAACALGAAALGLGARTGPYIAPVQTVSMQGLTSLLRDRVQRRISVGYFGHMWEVYGMWIWLPSLLLLLPAFGDLQPSAPVIALWTFVLIGVAGMFGCIVGGALSHRFGKPAVTRVIVLVSGVCCLLTPLLGRMPFWLAIAVLALWGAATIGDSALYSAMTGDVSGQQAVGTAIVTQMALGYAVSVGAIYVVPLFATLVGTDYAALILLLGPMTSLVAMRGVRASATALGTDGASVRI